jgi:hypothetical protein
MRPPTPAVKFHACKKAPLFITPVIKGSDSFFCSFVTFFAKEICLWRIKM